jgi:hypothetical protein
MHPQPSTFRPTILAFLNSSVQPILRPSIECWSRGGTVEDINYGKPLVETTPRISMRIFQLPCFFLALWVFRELVFSQYESDIILTSQVGIIGQRALSVDRSRIVVETLGAYRGCLPYVVLLGFVCPVKTHAALRTQSLQQLFNHFCLEWLRVGRAYRWSCENLNGGEGRGPKG